MSGMNKEKFESRYDIWLSMCENIGNIRAKLLVDYFGSAEKVYKADTHELSDIEGISAKMIRELMNKDLSGANKLLSECEEKGCSLLTISDKNYPSRLRNIYDPPTVLYIKGKLPSIDDFPVVGIVGTRWCTPYGVRNAENVGRILSQHGIIVTTGLAKGIDTAAANGALQGEMPVVGVVGCGVDIVYPPRNKTLFENVSAHGAIISEYPFGTEARPEFFPPRNRIISGLSLGVAVIEAPLKSGALITAQRALEQSRDIFVLPGNVDARACAGSNKLLREGAIPFMTAEDIIDEYVDLFDTIKKPIDNETPLDYIDLEQLASKLDENERAIVRTMAHTPQFIEEIISKTKIAAQLVLASLTALELDGHIKRDNSGRWEIAVS